MDNRLSVIWICHFSNSNIRGKLPLSDNYDYADSAPWITQMIEQFKTFDDIRLYIIAPHIGLKQRIITICEDHIQYFFYRNSLTLFRSKFMQLWGFRIDKLFLFMVNKMRIRYIYKKHINFIPDIINLIGFENPEYSTGIFCFRKLPVLITVQGIYSNPERFVDEKKDMIKYFLERSIIKRHRYYCIGASFYSKLILRDRKDAILFWNFFPRDLPKGAIDPAAKEYDFVFFGRIIKTKGIEDLIEALAIVKNIKHDVSLLLMGPINEKYLTFLISRIQKLDLSTNITYLGNQKSMDQLHDNAHKARFFVLPTHLDGLPGSVLECMYMKLPVVTTNVGELPYLNKDGETILMSSPNDVKALSNNMIRLLQEPELANRLASTARFFIEKEFNHLLLCRKLIAQYKAVKNNYISGCAIDPGLLFNPTIK